MNPAEVEQLHAKVVHLEREAKLYRAHVENLIERVYELEQTVEVMVSRLAAVERATPLRAPDKPVAKKGPPRLPPSKRPVR
jgi:hypothetical protein